MRRPDGYSAVTDPGGPRLTQEADLVTCIHCGHIDMTRFPNGNLEVMIQRADGSHYFKQAGFCRNCMHHICPKCDGKPCRNRFAYLDEIEKAARKLQLVCL